MKLLAVILDKLGEIQNNIYNISKKKTHTDNFLMKNKKRLIPKRELKSAVRGLCQAEQPFVSGLWMSKRGSYGRNSQNNTQNNFG